MLSGLVDKTWSVAYFVAFNSCFSVLTVNLDEPANMKSITIGSYPELQFKEFASTCVASFTTIWLVLEPLGSFGIFPNAISSSGWVGYLSLFIISLFFAISTGQIWRKIKFNNSDIVQVAVESSIEGTTYLVRTPANMQAWEFCHLFIEFLERGKSGEKVRMTKRHFSPVLNLRRGEEKIEVDENVSLSEIGIVSGDILFVSGKLTEVDRTPRFCVG